MTLRLRFCVQCVELKNGRFCSHCGAKLFPLLPIRQSKAPLLLAKPPHLLPPSLWQTPPASFIHTVASFSGTSKGGKIPEFPFISKKRYKLLELIGQGGMGEVWKALDHQTQRIVALKRLQKIANLQRFFREAMSIAKLNHPFIVPLFDVGQDEEGPFLTMQFVEGKTLYDYVKERGKLELREGLELMIKIGQAIFYAHRHGVIHRDIKPQNIMIDSGNLPRILDFGLARLTTAEDLTQTGALMGTYHYVSPEQLENPASVDHRTDIYSLGATLYFMLTGEVPRLVRPDRLPQEVLKIVLKCMEERVELRYYSVDRFVEDMEELLQGKKEPKVSSSSFSATEKKIVKGLCQCGHVNDPEVQFCENCGEPLVQTCPNCQRRVSINVKNCGYCGVSIAKRRKALQLFEEAKQHYNRKELEEALLLAEKALAADFLPLIKEFSDKVKKLLHQFRHYAEQGEKFLKEEKWRECYQYFSYALEIQPSEELHQKLEVVKKKLHTKFLEEALSALERGEVDEAYFLCLEAKKFHSSQELIELLERIERGKFAQSEEESEEEEDVVEITPDLYEEIFRLSHEYERFAEKRKSQREKEKRYHQLTRWFVQIFSWVLFWCFVGFLLTLAILTILVFMGKI